MTAKHPKKKDRPGVDRAGRAPLHYAASDGNLTEVKRLLAEGADPSAADDDGWTPLHFAARGWNVEIAALLLAAGAKVDMKDSHGNTALGRAVSSSRGRGELITLLRKHGADPDIENNFGVSPLKYARTVANFDIAQWFADLS